MLVSVFRFGPPPPSGFGDPVVNRKGFPQKPLLWLPSSYVLWYMFVYVTGVLICRFIKGFSRLYEVGQSPLTERPNPLATCGLFLGPLLAWGAALKWLAAKIPVYFTSTAAC